MENRNIYKMDDVLIVVSFLMLIPAVYFAWPWLMTLKGAEEGKSFFLSAPAILGGRLTMVFLYLGGSITAQIFGRMIRKKEKQALDVLDTILYMKNTTFDQLALNLSMPRERVEKITQKLSRISSLNIKVEGDSVKMESPLSGFTSAPQTSQSPVKPLEQEKTGAALPSLGKTVLSFSQMSPEEQKKMKRNGVIIFILFMTPLWPVALIMVIVFVVRQAKGKGIIIQPASRGEELPQEQD